MKSDRHKQTPVNVVFHQGALGDWVIAFPILRGLVGRTICVTDKGKGELAAALIEDVACVDVQHHDFAALFSTGGAARITEPTRKMLARSKLVLSFVSSGHDAWATNLQQLAKQAERYFLTPPDPQASLNVLESYEQQLRRQGASIIARQAPARKMLAGPLLLHPGSGGEHKCWPLERFIELAGVLQAAGRDILFVLGEVEMDRWHGKVIDALAARFAMVHCNTPLDLLAAIQRAGLFIGNDSGPGHLAGQAGVPALIFFGPTPPRIWMPTGPRVEILAPPGLAAMSWLTVDQAARKALGMLALIDSPC